MSTKSEFTRISRFSRENKFNGVKKIMGDENDHGKKYCWKTKAVPAMSAVWRRQNVHYGATNTMGLDATQTPPNWVKVTKAYYQCDACGMRAAWRKRKNQNGFWEPVKKKEECTVKEKMLKDIEKRLPDEYFGRAEAVKALRGLMTLSTLRYLDEKGQGPESSMFGGRRKYKKRGFLSWLEKRIKE